MDEQGHELPGKKPMSKAFTKDEPSDEPVIVPERAPLPPGVPNYVTDRGLKLLEEERRHLLEQRAALAGAEEDDDVAEGKRQLRVVNQRLRDLTERIATAQRVAPPARPDRTVRFGAAVTLRTVGGDDDGDLRRIKLVGVDEAAESASLVSFAAPIARAILGHQPGDKVTRRAGSDEEVLEIVDVEYESPNAPAR
jgi:transcription elongation factor GreB